MERCSNLRLKTEDNPYPSKRVRVLNFTVQILDTVSNFIIETGFRCPGIRYLEITRVYNADAKRNLYTVGIRYLEITVFSFVVTLNMGDQFTKKYILRIRKRVFEKYGNKKNSPPTYT